MNKDDELRQLKLYLQALETKKASQWADGLSDGDLTLLEAKQKVTIFFKGHLRDPITSKNKGGRAYLGIHSLKSVLPSLTPTEEEICSIIERSFSDWHTFQALRVFARITRNRDSQALKRWENELILGIQVEPAKPRGKSPFINVHRDLMIISQLRQLEAVGFKPTQSEAKALKSSGCDIVAAALGEAGVNVTYSAVEAVWKNRRKIGLGQEVDDLIHEGISQLLDKLEASEDKSQK